MSDYVDQLRGAVQAVEVLSPTTFSWFGARSPEIPENVRSALTPRTARSFLLYNLQWQLYHNFYCRGGAQPVAHEVSGSLLVGVTPFIEELQSANAGQGYWEAGWTALAEYGDAVAAGKNGLTLLAQPGDYASLSNGTSPPGIELGLRFPKDLLGISPGFYMALGNSSPGQQDVVRFYWNVSAEGAVRLMRLVTHEFNAVGLPYNLKVVNDPAHYNRCDAAVLYARMADYPSIYRILWDMYPKIEETLSSRVPALTRQLAPGLGLAEDPGYGESFGLHRCMVLAEGLIRAYEAGVSGVDGKLASVLGCFAEAGINLKTPYLRPGSSDSSIEIGSTPRRATAAKSANAKTASTPTGLQSTLETAVAIGDRLVREAVWHDGQCNWVGATLRDPTQPAVTYKALGPDLYNGTAGVALFLAELFAVTHEHRFKETAGGAIRQALGSVGNLPAKERLGLYSGKPGIALAVTRIAPIIDQEEIMSDARHLLSEVAGEQPGREYDLLVGSAGAIVGLLELRNLAGDDSFVQAAARMGDHLLQTAHKDRSGYSWSMHGQHFARNLTGFSHGAAGIGLALLELYAATGEERYRQGAEAAFSYERRWFDPEEGNWPDFRNSGRGQQPRQFSTFWCHGAPGIALSRLRAYRLLADERYRVEAEAALATTRKWLESNLNSGNGNYSLCHGLAGNAEVLLYGSRTLTTGAEDALSLALRVAHAGQVDSVSRGGTWSCGAGGGETPGLMLGLAGIGLFFLRLHDPTISTVLLYGPSTNTAGRADTAQIIP